MPLWVGCILDAVLFPMILDQNHVIVVGPKDPLYQRRQRMPFWVGCSVKNISSIIVTSYLYSYLSSLSMFCCHSCQQRRVDGNWIIVETHRKWLLTWPFFWTCVYSCVRTSEKIMKVFLYAASLRVVHEVRTSTYILHNFCTKHL